MAVAYVEVVRTDESVPEREGGNGGNPVKSSPAFASGSSASAGLGGDEAPAGFVNFCHHVAGGKRDPALDPDAAEGPDASAGNGGGASLAAARASEPNGTPNLPSFSRLDTNASCFAFGPALGNVKSVRVAVCASGAEIELSEMDDMLFGTLRLLLPDRLR